jgi:signal transduction histidine kinase
MARNEIKYVADVELDLGPVEPVKATGGELNQVLLNLLVNSAQAIESQKRKEKGRILVRTREEGGKVVLVIADDGPGIPEDLRLQVFDPFFTTKDPGKGTGLGLSISYDIIVRKHGGAIRISTSSLGGAEFRIELPIQGAGQADKPEGPGLDDLDGR